jgi:hypothetical protein
MPLSVGAKLGPYKILAPIGAGGMGEVYRARDTNLDRDVAVKVLPVALAQDPDRLTRFKREAKVLASLNHPNIAQIYDVEDEALIIKLVDGEAPRGPLSIETALLYARQIAEALEAAHEKGIVHRDLKPANIKVTPEGVVKVLDFGLAAVAPGSAMNSDPTKSPTMTLAATQAGTVLGTAAYMSPEQAAGKPVDKRADIWSFGVVLFELLTGHRLFEGETVSHTLAGVLAGPIDFDQLPREAPPAIRILLRRCLERNPKNRLRDIGEARIAIDAAFQPVEPAAPPPQPRRPFAWIAAATIFGLAFRALALVHFREAPTQRQRAKFQIAPPGNWEFSKHDHRHLLQLQLLSRQQTAVARDDAGVAVDENGVHEAELGDAGRDLHDLLLGMRARVALVRNQPVDRPDFDTLRHCFRKHHLHPLALTTRRLTTDDLQVTTSFYLLTVAKRGNGGTRRHSFARQYL